MSLHYLPFLASDCCHCTLNMRLNENYLKDLSGSLVDNNTGLGKLNIDEIIKSIGKICSLRKNIWKYYGGSVSLGKAV